eukprot:60706_1
MTSFQKIDSALGQYYQEFGAYDYFDNDGFGKFWRFCKDEEFDPTEVDQELATDNESDCGYLDFDTDFPFRNEPNESEKRTQMFRILQHCHRHGAPPPLPSNKPKKVKYDPRRAMRFNIDFTGSSSTKRNVKKPPDTTAQPQEFETKQNNEPNKPYDDDMLNDDLHKLCTGIGLYYRSMKRNDYYNAQGIGKFTEWFEAAEMDVDDMKEELINGDMEGCLYLDFDRDVNSQINYFPLPGDTYVDEKAKLHKQFEIMARIYEDGHPPILSKGFDITFDVEEEDKEKAIQLYKAQCPRLIECFENEQDLMYLLAVSYQNNLPFALWMVDCYMRDRLNVYLKHRKQLTVNEWTESVYSNGISQYMKRLKAKYTVTKEHDIVTCIQHGIKAYINRILPQFKFDAFCTIKDNIFDIAHYIEAASQFIFKLLREDRQLMQVYAPFQWDFCIAVADVTDKKGNVLIPFGVSPHDVMDHAVMKSDEKDILGDIEKKLQSNGCPYYIHEVTTMNKHHTKNNLLIRPFWTCYDKFRDIYGLKEYGKNKYNAFPRMRRFCTLIDRRKCVITTDEKKCEANKGLQCNAHEERDRNEDGRKKDDIYIWIPPGNCDVLPADKNGYVAEVFLDNLNTCVIPRMGYSEDPLKPTKCRLLTSTITSKNHCNERLLTFSFHIESTEEIRCYLWWKGCCLRFMPRDIVEVLPLMFDKTYGNNAKFVTDDNIKDLVQQIRYKDHCFEQWYKKVTD